jgi:hypothetical protein
MSFAKSSGNVFAILVSPIPNASSSKAHLTPQIYRYHQDYENAFSFCAGGAQELHFGREKKMPAKNPRVNVVLEKPLYDSVRRLATKEEISLSLKIRDLIKDGLEAQEDIVLAEVAEEREKTFRRTRKPSGNRAAKIRGAAEADTQGRLEATRRRYRIVFRIVKNEVWIFALMHRRDVDQRIETRLSIR